MELKLTNVHEALHDSALKNQNNPAMVSVTIRLPEPVKQKVTTLCVRHGTTLSAFLRECAEGLVRDYGEPAE